MKFIDKILTLLGIKELTEAQKLYIELSKPEYRKRPYHYVDKQENMSLIEGLVGRWWKPIYLVNHEAKCAYEIMDWHEVMHFVRHEDIVWESLTGLEPKAIKRAEARSAHFPTSLNQFENGIAQIDWQINPDGMYYMDSDGYGITDDDEITITGFINKRCQVIAPFRYLRDRLVEVPQLRATAEKSASK